MAQLLEFTTNHWVLMSALLVVLTLLAYNLAQGSQGMVAPLAATEMINRKEAVILDVRPMADYAAGHIINSINIPINGFSNQISQLNKHKNKPIVVSCRSGAQSTQACRQLRKVGFENVYSLKGGILAWQSANLPVTRKK